jgi:hypothetical protein
LLLLPGVCPSETRTGRSGMLTTCRQQHPKSPHNTDKNLSTTGLPMRRLRLLHCSGQPNDSERANAGGYGVSSRAAANPTRDQQPQHGRVQTLGLLVPEAPVDLIFGNPNTFPACWCPQATATSVLLVGSLQSKEPIRLAPGCAQTEAVLADLSRPNSQEAVTTVDA